MGGRPPTGRSRIAKTVSLAVRFEDEAEAEYRHAGRWYEERRTGLGLEFFDAVDAALSQVVRLPRAGARVPRVSADLSVRRAPVKRFPYQIVYLEAPEAIRILAVAHDRRSPGYWKHRLKTGS
jgi:plasmid stabilization system protein ParE